MVAPYTVVPGTRTPSMLLQPTVTPYVVRPFRVGGPDWITQRFYLRSTTVAEVSPDFDAAWDDVDDAVRRHLATTRADTAAQGATISWTSGQLALDRQYVTGMLRGGVVFDGGAITAIIRTLEPSTTDNVTTRIGVRVVSASGALVRATLLDVGHYGTNTEYSSPGSSARIFANAESLGSYTTQHGDRLVVEVGHGDAAGTTPQAGMILGSNGATDLTLEETVQGGHPWIEFTPAA